VRLALLLTAALLTTAPVLAAPVDYILQPEASSVAFEIDFGTNKITGSFPLAPADLTMDFDNASNSTIDVTLDVTGSQASFPFAAQALQGPTVLDAQAHPKMHFASTRVVAKGDGGSVSGNLTIQGVTRPVTLQTRIFRQAGYAEGDRRHLSVRLTVQVLRSAFGANGWADLVGDEVRILIDARIAKKL